MARGSETLASPPPVKTAGPATQVPAPSFEVTDNYTAQRRPRAAVFVFDNANKGARDTLYGSSVEAMLVTFLKRKSQFVVLERKDLDLKTLFNEKARLQRGQINLNLDDEEGQALLEKTDVFVLGSVTVLDYAPPVTQKPDNVGKDGEDKRGDEKIAGEGEDIDEEGEDFDQSESDKDRAKKLDSVPGPRIEVDLKLISHFDGRIIAAAQRSGPVACLRSIVERLGIALEQEFLRPHYGKLTVNLAEPEHIRVFLTPILPKDALDEEKPPVEYSSTVTIGSGYDTVETWTTDPTTYTIRNVLSGWYSMRIERPGYDSIGSENSRWEVRKQQDKEVVYDRVADVPIDKADPRDSRFVVRVDPLTTEVVDGDALGFKFQKQGGSLAPLVKRQYLDTNYSQSPRRVILMGGKRIEINQLQRPAEYADDERCDLFEERKPLLANYGRTYITAGQPFEFSSFKGGELIIEDYRGEVIPVGVYDMVLWEPSYQTEKAKVRVRVGDDKKEVKTNLTRETGSLSLLATGPRPTNQVFLKGEETQQQFDYRLDFENPKEIQSLPADKYLTTTNVTGLDGWQGIAEIASSNVIPPVFDIKSPKHKLGLLEAPLSRAAIATGQGSGIKTHFNIAGRLDTLSEIPDPLAADLFIDKAFPSILNLLLYGAIQRPEEGRVDDTTPKPHSANDQSAGGSPSQEPPADPEGQRALKERTALTYAQLLRDPSFLRKLLAGHLALIDLVVLDPEDMARLRRSPEVAAIFAQYLASGGALFAYVSEVGNYRQVIGAPLAIEKLSKRTRRLDLAPGEVEDLIPKLSRKEVKVKAKRQLPEVADLSTPWRTLAYTRKGRRPRIVERGGQVEGGYVALWLDNPQAFRGRWGGTRPKVEEARGRVEEHVIQQARALMRLRFDRSSQALQPCTPNPFPSSH